MITIGEGLFGFSNVRMEYNPESDWWDMLFTLHSQETGFEYQDMVFTTNWFNELRLNYLDEIGDVSPQYMFYQLQDSISK